MGTVARKSGAGFVEHVMGANFIPVTTSRSLGLVDDDVLECASYEVPFSGAELARGAGLKQLLVAIPTGVSLKLLATHHGELFGNQEWHQRLMDRHLDWLLAEARPGYYLTQVPGRSTPIDLNRQYDRPYVVEAAYLVWAWRQIHKLDLSQKLFWCRDEVHTAHGHHYFVDPVKLAIGWGSDLETHAKVSPILAEYRPFSLIAL